MTEIVINRKHGGFGLSEAAKQLYLELGGPNFDLWDEIDRDCPQLVAVVKQLGEQADGRYSHLKIVTVPDDVDWYIEEYDGLEWVAERHKVWY